METVDDDARQGDEQQDEGAGEQQTERTSQTQETERTTTTPAEDQPPVGGGDASGDAGEGLQPAPVDEEDDPDE